MWTIIKLDKKKIKLFENELEKKIGNNFMIYNPKIMIQKYYKNRLLDKHINLLGDYIMCHHPKFKALNTVKSLRNLRGLKYFLEGCISHQKEIQEFVNKCKNLENEKGFISKNFFEAYFINRYYKFSSGPFVEKIFKIIELQKNKINILMGNVKTTISKEEFLFNPV